MRTQLESFLGLVGLFVLAGSFAGSVFRVFRDPFYIFWTACGGFLLAAWFCFSVWTDTTEPAQESSIHGADGKKIRKLPDFRRGQFVRWVSAFLVLISLIIIGCIIRSERGVFDLVYASKPDFSQHKLFQYVPAEGEEAKLPDTPPPPTYYVAAPEGKETSGDLSIRSGDTVRFVIAKRPRVPWLEIESINITVNDFDPKVFDVRPYATHYPEDNGDRFQRPVHFVAKIAPPSDGNNTSRAVFTGFEADEKDEFGFLLLEDDRPLPIVVTIQGKTPGVYTYSMNVRVRNLWRTDNIPIYSDRKCMYRPRPPGFIFDDSQKAVSTDRNGWVALANGGE